MPCFKASLGILEATNLNYRKAPSTVNLVALNSLDWITCKLPVKAKKLMLCVFKKSVACAPLSMAMVLSAPAAMQAGAATLTLAKFVTGAPVVGVRMWQ